VNSWGSSSPVVCNDVALSQQFSVRQEVEHLVIDLELELPLADPPASSEGSVVAREDPRRWWSSRSTWQVSADGEKYALQRLT